MGSSTAIVSRKISGWKRHECLSCGCEFRYKFARKIDVRGSSEADAEAKADRAFEAARVRQVDLQPCPECDYVQPDMVGQFRRPVHLRIAMIGGILLLLFATLGMSRASNCGLAGLPTEGLLVVGVFLCAVAHAIVIVFSFSLGSSDFRKRVGWKRYKGDLEIIEPSTRPESRWKGPRVHTSDIPILTLHLIPALLASGIALIPRPEQSQFPDTIETSGAVGRTIRIYVANIGGVNGHWRATATAVVTNEDAFPNGVPTVVASSREDRWDREFSARSQYGNESVSKLYVDLQLPNDRSLLGKTLELRVVTTATSPKADKPFGDAVTRDLIRVRGITVKNDTMTVNKKVIVRMTSGWELPSLSWGLQALAVIGQFLVVLLAVGLALTLAGNSLRFGDQANPVTFETNAERKADHQRAEVAKDQKRRRKPRRDTDDDD